jgi:choline dehydrogenase-like flavoprotein
VKTGDRFDAIVVGAGAAGCLAASRLAQAGRSVLILEAGPERSLRDLSSSQLWARRLKWGGAPVIETGKHPIGHNFNVGWGTGGAALHHFAVWPRLHPADFSMASDHGRGFDWPLGYADLRPWYDTIQQEVGIAGDHTQEPWRPEGAPYNQAPVPVFRHAELIARGFAALGMRTAPLPLAIRTSAEGQRGACIWDGWCDAGCPIGALANPLVTYLPRALAAGAQLRHHATVTEILTDASGARATGVNWREESGAARSAEAAVVVLAASTTQNSRLLLASRSRSPHGLANSSGQVGRHIMTHLACPVFGLWDEETQCHMGVNGGQLLNQDNFTKTRPGGPFGSWQWNIGNAMKPNDLLGIAMSRVDLHGAALDEFMRRAARGFAMMTGVVEDLPQADNRVSLLQRTDRWGVPLAQVAHSCVEESLALWESARAQGVRVMQAGGAVEAWAGNIGPMHNMGGTMMGHDAASSVTNSYGQCHDVPNLLIAGASLFPTGGAVNPTFTIHALAARSMRHLLENWSDIAVRA